EYKLDFQSGRQIQRGHREETYVSRAMDFRYIPTKDMDSEMSSRGDIYSVSSAIYLRSPPSSLLLIWICLAGLVQEDASVFVQTAFHKSSRP
ncbi:hypothetical protein P692DRAFT_20839365, partial [Suillus brevipes Sb2]